MTHSQMAQQESVSIPSSVVNKNEIPQPVSISTLQSDLSKSYPNKEAETITLDENSLTSTKIFAKEIVQMTNQKDINEMLDLQLEIFERLKQSNEALESINEFSTKSFAVLQKEFEKHIKMIKEMKKDLEYIHRKIRHCKAKLNKRFPESAIVKTGC